MLDVADLGGRLYALDPTEAEPATHATALQVEDDRTLRVVDLPGRVAPGYDAPGEAMTFTFGADSISFSTVSSFVPSSSDG